MTRLVLASLVTALVLTSPASRAMAQTVPAISTTAPYRINSGDELEVYVWGEERLQRKVKVLPDGTMAFPLVGQLTVTGMLPKDLEAVISDRLQPQYRGQVPQVTVSVLAAVGLQFSVMGKVKTPGTFSPGRYVNLLEALSLAGGPAEFANLDSLVIIRKGNNEGLSTLKVRVGALFKSGVDNRIVSQAEIPTIQSGDTVIVP